MKFIDERAEAMFSHINNIPKTEGLDEIHSARFDISTKERILYEIVNNNDVITVAGSFFGDEGKGKTVAAIARHPDISMILRVNSGENAGHTVIENGVKYVFHLAPSGLLMPGKINGIGPNCVMDPISFMDKEIQQLINNNIDYSNLMIDNVMIVTPYHKIIDALGRANSSTMKGMSPVHASLATKKGLRLDDLFNDKDLAIGHLRRDMEIYNALTQYRNISEQELLEQFENHNEIVPGRIPKHVIDFVTAKDKTEFLWNLYQENIVDNNRFPKRGDVVYKLQEVLNTGGKLLLEGPQSFFLGNDIIEHWRKSTSAHTSASGVQSAAGYNTNEYKTATINVNKVPNSRVGIGENPAGYVPQDFFSSKNIQTLDDLGNACEDFQKIMELFYGSVQENGILNPARYEDETGEYSIGAAMAIASSKTYGERGATTMKPRVCGLFDCVAQAKVNRHQGPYLTISAIDRFDNSKKVGLVIAYVVNSPDKELDSKGIKYNHGDLIKPGQPMPCEQVLAYCQPIIKVMDGWNDNPIAVDKRNNNGQLPQQLQRLLGEIEFYTGSEIISIGNGPDTNDLIYLERVE